jgi:hypothetical protein
VEGVKKETATRDYRYFLLGILLGMTFLSQEKGGHDFSQPPVFIW